MGSDNFGALYHKEKMNLQKIHEQLQISFAEKGSKSLALQKQAYMKSTMPYWGLYRDQLAEIVKKDLVSNAPQTNAEYRETIEYIFTHATHREEWYAALIYAMKFKKYIIEDNIDLYQQLIMQGQWWDIIDTIAPNLLGVALKGSPKLTTYTMQWIKDENMWVRRSAILTQLMYKKDMDFALLEKLILTVAHEKEFFIRKAIGWVLRGYSKTDKLAVRNFIETHRNKLSNLSIREGSKYI